jgi:hypothetical protein
VIVVNQISVEVGVLNSVLFLDVTEEDGILDNSVDVNGEVESSVERELPVVVCDIVEEIIDPVEDIILVTRGPVEITLDNKELGRDISISVVLVPTG